eukprot:TRINITY_DN7189_c0_g1_i1.p1 TRINITY_DN7189_c0_g1~~TRINITY_DN7189_c0_g1_i1.p1  ORF type:complete len:305 (-),score=8.22 TRINITY_DN7189_c0_g1_i1:2-916(-)
MEHTSDNTTCVTPQHVDFSLIRWIFVGAFVITFLACLLRIFFVFFRSNRNTQIPLTKYIYLLLPWAMMARFIDMSLLDSKTLVYNLWCPFTFQPMVRSVILGGFPNYIFSLTYTLLLVYWIIVDRRYSKTRNGGDPLKVAKIFYAVYAFIVMGLWILLIVLMWNNQDDEEVFRFYHRCEVVYIVCLQAASSIAFLIIGSRLYFKLSKKKSVNDRQANIHKSVGTLTVTLTIIFLIRATLLIAMGFFMTSGLPLFICSIIFMSGFEIFPVVIILVSLAKQESGSGGAKALLTNTNSVDIVTYRSI